MNVMTESPIGEPGEKAVLAAALQTVAVECVHFDAADRPAMRRLMPLAALLSPFEGLVSPRLTDALRDAS